MPTRTALKINKQGNVGKAVIVDGKLQIQWVPGGNTEPLTYEPEDIDKEGFILEDAVRNDLKALKKAGFVLHLKVKDLDLKQTPCRKCGEIPEVIDADDLCIKCALKED